MKRGIRAALVAALLLTLTAAFTGDTPPAAADHGLLAQARCLEFAISPSGDEAWVPSPDRHTLRRVRLSDGHILASRKFHSIINAVDISPEGDLLAIAFGTSNRVILADPKTLEPEAEIPTGKRPRLLEFGFEGTDLCVLCPKDEEIDLIDVPGKKVDLIIPFGSKPLAMAHFKNSMAITVPDEGVIQIFSHPDHQFVLSIPMSPAPEWIARGVTPDGLEPVRPGHAGHTGVPYATGQPIPFSQAMAPAKEVLLATSRESDLLTVIDSENYQVLGVVPVHNPRMVVGGCSAAPYAFVLHSHGMKLSVVDIDASSPGFLDVLYTVDLPEPGETMRVANDGTCYVLGWSHHALYAVKNGEVTKLKLKKKNQDDD